MSFRSKRIESILRKRACKSCSSKRLMRSGSIVNDPAFGLRSGRGWWGKHVNLGGAGTASGLVPCQEAGSLHLGSDLGSSISNSPSSSFNPAMFWHFDPTCSVKHLSKVHRCSPGNETYHRNTQELLPWIYLNTMQSQKATSEEDP